MKQRIFKLLSILFLLILFSYMYVLLNKQYNFFIPCFFHEITGFHCPGCGVTRMLFSLLNGNLKEAFQYNQLLFIFLPFFIFFGVYKAYNYIYCKEDQITKKIPKVVWYSVIILFILFGILRNMKEFSFLAPNIFH